MLNAARLHNFNHALYRRKIPIIPKVIEGLIQFIYGCRIPPSCELGEGTMLAYAGMGVLMVSGTKFGARCSIGAGVKIVRKFPYKNVPHFGDDVYIGPNAIVCGPVRVGNQVVIAPGSVVLNSIPDDAVVAGIPAKIIGRTSNLGYVINDNPKFKDGISPFLDIN